MSKGRYDETFAGEDARYRPTGDNPRALARIFIRTGRFYTTYISVELAHDKTIQEYPSEGRKKGGIKLTMSTTESRYGIYGTTFSVKTLLRLG